jgi:hypothetical protein
MVRTTEEDPVLVVPNYGFPGPSRKSLLLYLRSLAVLPKSHHRGQASQGTAPNSLIVLRAGVGRSRRASQLSVNQEDNSGREPIVQILYNFGAKPVALNKSAETPVI